MTIATEIMVMLSKRGCTLSPECHVQYARIQDRQVVEELHQLEGAGDTPPGDEVGRQALDLLSLKDDPALLRA